MTPGTPGALFCILSVSSVESHRKRSHEEGRSSFLQQAPPNLVRFLTQVDGDGERGWFPLSFIPLRDAWYPCRMLSLPPSPPFSRVKSLFRARARAFVGWRTFRRTEIMKSETQGTYSRSPSPPPPVCRITFALPSGPGCPRARRLAKVRMMYRAATIMASLAAVSETSSRLSSIIFNADKYHSPKLPRDNAEYPRDSRHAERD